jgi:hypothetical protein
LTFTNCTFCDNSDAGVAAIYAEWEFTMTNTIIAFSQGGAAIECWSTPTLTCCDLYGNMGGDWVGSIAGQYGINGNISENPLFCNRIGGEFQLRGGSPCAPFSPPNQECDLIGAWPVGCDPTSGIADDEPGPQRESSSWGGIKVGYR